MTTTELVFGALNLMCFCHRLKKQPTAAAAVALGRPVDERKVGSVSVCAAHQSKSNESQSLKSCGSYQWQLTLSNVLPFTAETVLHCLCLNCSSVCCVAAPLPGRADIRVRSFTGEPIK